MAGVEEFDFVTVFSVTDPSDCLDFKVDHTYGRSAEEPEVFDYRQPIAVTIFDRRLGHHTAAPYDLWLRLVAASAAQKEQ